jgi:hypothetical protein
MIYSKAVADMQRFLGDVLEFRSVEAGDDWPIYAAPPTELAVHPTDGASGHELFLVCDDIHAVTAALAARGVTTTAPITARSWGLATTLRLPGGDEIGIYEPRHLSPLRPSSSRTRYFGANSLSGYSAPNQFARSMAWMLAACDSSATMSESIVS